MKPVIICFGCRRRVTPQEIADGQHSHADTEKPQQNAAPNQLTS